MGVMVDGKMVRIGINTYVLYIYIYIYIYIQIYLLSNLVLVSAVSYLSFPEFTSPFPGDFLVAPFLHCFPFWFLGYIFSAFSICTCITYVYAFFQKASVEDKPTSQQHNLSTLNPTACCFLETLFQFFEQKHSSLHKRIPPLLTWNPSSLATIHQGPSPKMCLILKRARSHICFIQETNWSTVQYNHVALSAPFCSISHSPATGEGSSGVVTFLPHPLTASSHSIITPGYLLTISTSIGGLSVELINVYLHPRKISQLGSSLLAHLRSEPSRSHDLRFIGGDLNQINTKVPNLYQQIIMELNCIPAPTLPTYRLPNGYTSPLDAFLLQYPDYLSSSPPKFLTFWPSFERYPFSLSPSSVPALSTYPNHNRCQIHHLGMVALLW